MTSVVRRINFQYVPIRIDVLRASTDNPVYRAALMTYIQPFALAARLGRVSEEAATLAWAKVYAEAVIVGSPDDPYVGYDRAAWIQWLTEHPEEFERLRELCTPAENFQDGAEA